MNNNYQMLKEELLKFNGTDLVISTIGNFSSVMQLNHCIVSEFGGIKRGINICNINNIVEGENSVAININEDEVKNVQIKREFYNEEIILDWTNGESVLIIGNEMN